jgi:uncharacterized RDD family membrane protein YckC
MIPAPATSQRHPPAAVPNTQVATPGIWRRMACFIYEGVLLFGVLMIAAYLFSTLTQQRHALLGRHGLMAFLFLVLGIYFVWFWSDGRQTVAMRAWHIRLVDRVGGPVSQWRALARYVLSYLWFMPALLGLWLSGLRGAGTSFAIMLAGVVAYAVLARFHPQRQFLHDVICATRLVDARPPDRR